MKMPENPDFGCGDCEGAFGDGRGGGGGRFLDDDDDDDEAAAAAERCGIDGLFAPAATGSPLAAVESFQALFSSLMSQLFVE